MACPCGAWTENGRVTFEADLTSLVDENISIEFRFESDNDDFNAAEVYSGWYIDDVKVVTE